MRAAADQRAAAAADPHRATVAALRARRLIVDYVRCPTARRELPRGCASVSWLPRSALGQSEVLKTWRRRRCRADADAPPPSSLERRGGGRRPRRARRADQAGEEWQ
eukprot:630496-Prymnesium_polylepis.1